LTVDEDKPSKPYCVIKQLFSQAQGTNSAQKAAELFQQEAVRLDELGKHPQIPNLLAYFTQDERQYLVQEFIDGQNLAQVLAAEGTFNQIQIRDLLKSLLPLLEFIHTHHIIHRDIKPENIIRRRDGQLMLVDFGAAKYATGIALLQTGTTIGTPEFIAPEQGKGKAVFASDLYSLGVTCIHLLTMISPFDLFDTGEGDWVWRDYLVNNSVSDELGSILDKLIENATKKRYQSADEVLKDLNPDRIANFTTLQTNRTLGGTTTTLVAPSVMSSIKVRSSSWKCVHTFLAHPGLIHSIALSPDGQTLASGSFDKTIKLWHLGARRAICTLTGHTESIFSVAFSPDGKTLASSSADKTIKIWKPMTGRMVYTLTGHSGYVFSVVFSPDGKTLASSSLDKTIKIWDIMSGKETNTFRGNLSAVRSIAFSPDGNTLASGSQSVKLWRVETGEELPAFPGDLDEIEAIAMSGDGKTLVSGNLDKKIKVWRLDTGAVIKTLTGHAAPVKSVAISPNGEILATGSVDKTIKIWQLNTGEELSTLRGHTGYVASLAFSADGNTLASGGGDGSIKLWRCESLV